MSEFEEEVLDDATDVVDDPSASAEQTTEPEQWQVSRDEWEATQRYLAQTAPLMEQVAAQLQQAQQAQWQAQQQAQQPQLPQEFDPFDPESVRSYIQAHIEAGVQNGVQSAISPYEGMLAGVAQSQGEAQARAAMDSLREELGEFDTDTAFMYASGVIDQVGDPTQALRFGAQQAKAFEDKIRADERERYKREMEELSQAPRQTPAGGTTADQVDAIPTGLDKYEQIAQRWLARQNPTHPVG